jgi:hypothetical protein
MKPEPDAATRGSVARQRGAASGLSSFKGLLSVSDGKAAYERLGETGLGS